MANESCVRRSIELPLDEEVRWILGRPNFWCASVAEQLRRSGRLIAKKAEEEQAAVIHWFLTLYLEHGAKWRDVAADELQKLSWTKNNAN